MKTSILALTAISMLAFSSCKKEKWPYAVKANGNIAEETRILSDFEDVAFDIPGNLYITLDPTIKSPEITIKTSDNLFERIDTKVKNGTLTIETNKCIRKLKDFDAYLTVKDLEDVSINGSGNIYGVGSLDVDILSFPISGSGNVQFTAHTVETSILISGSGSITAAGATEDIVMDVSGSGNIKGFDMEAQNAYINISGSGNCEVYATEYMDVNISGSGNVDYKGSPRIDISTSGSGSLNSK